MTLFKRIVTHITVVVFICATLIGLSYTVFRSDAISHKIRLFFPSREINNSSSSNIVTVTATDELGNILAKTSMPNKTLIITAVNDAWTEPNSMVDMFLQSFRIGEGTRELLNNVLIVAMDEKAFHRCREIHPHCYDLRTEGVDFSAEKNFMTKDYLMMMRTRILFLSNVIQRGYSFLFSDADVLWLRNPFPRLLADADFQISCDRYNHNPDDTSNMLNTGFLFVRSNQRTKALYNLWHVSTHLYPDRHDQDVLNTIKSSANFTDIGLKMAVLDTLYFSGFCEEGSDDVEVVCTVHANCCKGLKAKLVDLRVVLDDWILFRSFNPNSPLELKRRKEVHWRPRNECKRSWLL